MTLQLRAFGSLNAIDPSVSSSNYYIDNTLPVIGLYCIPDIPLRCGLEWILLRMPAVLLNCRVEEMSIASYYHGCLAAALNAKWDSRAYLIIIFMKRGMLVTKSSTTCNFHNISIQHSTTLQRALQVCVVALVATGKLQLWFTWTGQPCGTLILNSSFPEAPWCLGWPHCPGSSIDKTNHRYW